MNNQEKQRLTKLYKKYIEQDADLKYMQQTRNHPQWIIDAKTLETNQLKQELIKHKIITQ